MATTPTSGRSCGHWTRWKRFPVRARRHQSTPGTT